MTRTIAFLTLATLVLLPSSAAAQTASEFDAGALYVKKCAMCHGTDGTAKKIWASKGARNFNDPAWQKEMTDEQIFNDTKNGIKEKKMPAYEGKLTDEEIKAIVKHIRTLAPQEDSE